MAGSCFSSQYDIPPANLVELGTVQKVFVAFYKTPDDFYLHLDSSKESLDSLTTSLTKYCRNTRPHDGFEAREGVYCAARFATDNMWYRARILKRLPDRVQVLYIDYGNHDVVKLDRLRPLHESHASVPALALHCAIPSVASIGSTDVWPCAAVHQFQNMLNDADELHARFQWRDCLTGSYVVDVLGTPAAGQARANLSMQFLSDCVDTMIRLLVPQTAVPPAGAIPAAKALPVRALPVQELPEPHLSPPLAAARPSLGRAVQIPPAVLPQTDKIPIRITVIVNPTEFYAIVHADDDWEKTMEDMQKRLASCAVSSFPPMVDEIKEGTFWTCRFDPDGNWYRVRVTKSASEDRNQRAQVHFVDYGNSTLASVSNLRPLPSHLAALPACAHRMALSLVAPRDVGGEWDREAIEFFVAHTGFDTVFEARRKGRRDLGFESVTSVMLTTSSTPAVNINVLMLEKKFAALN